MKTGVIVKGRTPKELKDRIAEREQRGWYVVKEKMYYRESHPYQALMELVINRPGDSDG